MSSSVNFNNALGFYENIFPKLSLAHSTQCNVSSGNIFSVQCGISFSSYGSYYVPQDSVLYGIITQTCPLGPSVPDSSNAVLALTHLISTYLLAFKLSNAFVTQSSDSKNLSVNICAVPSCTLSNLANTCPLSYGFI